MITYLVNKGDVSMAKKVVFALHKYLQRNQDTDNPELTEDCFVPTDEEIVNYVNSEGIVNDVHYTVHVKGDTGSYENMLTVEFLDNK